MRPSFRQPVSNPLQFLAGLQRVDMIFVYPERQDIVLAGYAEGWKIDPQGNVVGVATDVVLKRLGMNFEPAPVPGLPSYLELLQATPGCC